ncbi:MAG: glycosyltransferase [Thermodesulfobacteriota bacterium]
MNKARTLTDIIIVNYKSTDYLLRCLRSIYNSLHGRGANIFVQDNDSRDGIERVRSEFPRVILSRNKDNLGFSRAVNKAISQGSSPYIILLNPDSVLLDGFFSHVISYMEKNPQVGIVGPKILDSDGSVQGSARTFPTPLTGLFGRSSLLTKFIPNNPFTRENILTTQSDGTTPMEVDWVSGACMVARRKAIQDVGPLDERFFMYWEDADWCRRMWHRGWKVVYFPQPSVIHYVGVSSNKALSRSLLEFHKSSYRLFEKYSTSYYRLLKPVAVTGLSLRLCFVLASNAIRTWNEKSRFAFQRREAALSLDREKKIRVLRIIARLNVGGPAIHVHSLTKGLDSSRFKSTLIAGKISPTEGDMAYLFDSTDTKPLIIPELQRDIIAKMDVRAFLRIFTIIRDTKPDIVHTHTAKAGTSARLAVVLYNLLYGKHIRTVHTFHGHIFEGYFSKAQSFVFVWIERLLAAFTDTIIAISNSQQNDLTKRFHIAPAKKVRTIKLGFNLEPLLNNKSKGQFRKKCGISPDTLLIGIVGRLVPIKNHRMFFQAARQFMDRNPGRKVQFLVVGDGELRDELKAFSRQLRLSDYVIFCGWEKEVHLIYADFDILALTSLNEGTPVSIIEAMASSVPVIATDAGGVRDLLGPSNNIPASDGFTVCERGILCRKDDVSGFAEGLQYLVDIDAISKRRLLTQARSFVQERFSEKRLIQDIESLYLDLMANGR